MSHRRSWFEKFCEDHILGVIVAAVGVGMVLAIVLPFWWWIVIVGVCLVIYAINNFFC